MPDKNYFSDDELRCPCCGLQAFDPAMLAVMNMARARFGRPIVLNSVCRCVDHNAAVKGARRSAHLVGPDGFCHAADICVVSDITRGELQEIFHDLGIRRFEVSDLHLHVDNAIWLPTPLLKAIVFNPSPRSHPMKLKEAKRKIAEIIPAIIGLIPALLELLKKKKFVLWYHGPDKQPYLLVDFAILRDGVSPGPGWVKKSNAMSHRQCVKAMTDLWALGPGVPVTPVFPPKVQP